MNTCVSIGASHEFRLSRVLLVYGKSSYDGFPYRHPFVTLHEVIHVGEEAHLCHQPPHSLKADAMCTLPFSARNTLAAMQAPFGIDVVETHISATDSLHQLHRNRGFSRERD